MAVQKTDLSLKELVSKYWQHEGGQLNGGFSRGKVALMAFGHCTNDIYMSFISPLLPLLISKFNLSLTLAGVLATFLSISAAGGQPLFGYLSDKFPGRLFAALGPLFFAVFIGMIGLAPTYSLIALLLVLGGLSSAAFHPQAAVMAAAASGKSRAFGMSIFIAGGRVGYALGPIIAASVASAIGLKNIYVAIVPGLVISFLLYKYSPAVERAGKRGASTNLVWDLRQNFKPLFLTWLIEVLRITVMIGMLTFLPVYMQHKGLSLIIGGASVSLFSFSGGLGSILGGYLSDRLGRKTIILYSMLFSPLPLIAFFQTSGATSAIFLTLAGLVLLSSLAVTLAMAQELIPQNASFASGLIMGWAWFVGGIALTIIGWLADHIGIALALELLAILPVPAFFLAISLPGPLRPFAPLPRKVSA